MRRLAMFALASFAAVPAGATPPSTRYPKQPVDNDRVHEQRSVLWDTATHPEKGPYATAVAEARQKLTDGDYAGTILVAERAIALLPEVGDAYQLRGTARLRLHSDWAGCADDLAAALAHQRDDKPVERTLRRDLGVCQARAGRLGDAEVTLTDAAGLAAPNDRDRWEIWARLGEVRVAMGKLDEAIAAFDTSIAEGSTTSFTLWQRAGAYDRARQPSHAADDVQAAMVNDRSRSAIDGYGGLPLLGTDDAEFLLGMAFHYSEQPGVEQALLYFRHFVAAAPTSPWKRRAEEHLHELAGVALPQTLAHTGNAPFDADAATKVVRDAMPKLRACLEQAPGAMIEVRITRAGPKAPPPKPGQFVRYRAPPPGVQTSPMPIFNATPTATNAAMRCIEPIADKLALPPVKDKETYYQVSFSVVAP